MAAFPLLPSKFTPLVTDPLRVQLPLTAGAELADTLAPTMKPMMASLALVVFAAVLDHGVPLPALKLADWSTAVTVSMPVQCCAKQMPRPELALSLQTTPVTPLAELILW